MAAGILLGNRLTRSLLRALKRHKRSNRESVVKLPLPDWNSGDVAFERHPPSDDAKAANLTTTSSQKARSAASTGTGGPGSGTVSAKDAGKGKEVKTQNVNGTISSGLKSSPASRPPKDSQTKISQLSKVERDGDGNVKFPIKLGVLTIEQLGTVEPSRRGFHTEKSIFPIGYRSKRIYTSMVRRLLYHLSCAQISLQTWFSKEPPASREKRGGGNWDWTLSELVRCRFFSCFTTVLSGEH